jgi:hypothetical protein
VQTIAKITAADYPDLLAAVADGISQRELARRYGCAPSLIARHVAKATRARELGELSEGPALDLKAQPHTGSMRELLEARIRDPRTSARDLASLLNARARLDAEETPAAEEALRMQLLAAKRRVGELEAAQFRLPRFMPGVDEWFDALPADVERWSELPDAPVELLDQCGGAHHVLAEDAWFFVEQLGWRTPPVFEPDEDVIEEWRARIAEYDARRAQIEPEPEDRGTAHAALSSA